MDKITIDEFLSMVLYLEEGGHLQLRRQIAWLHKSNGVVPTLTELIAEIIDKLPDSIKNMTVNEFITGSKLTKINAKLNTPSKYIIDEGLKLEVSITGLNQMKTSWNRLKLKYETSGGNLDFQSFLVGELHGDNIPINEFTIMQFWQYFFGLQNKLSPLLTPPVKKEINDDDDDIIMFDKPPVIPPKKKEEEIIPPPKKKEEEEVISNKKGEEEDIPLAKKPKEKKKAEDEGAGMESEVYIPPSKRLPPVLQPPPINPVVPTTTAPSNFVLPSSVIIPPLPKKKLVLTPTVPSSSSSSSSFSLSSSSSSSTTTTTSEPVPVIKKKKAVPTSFIPSTSSTSSTPSIPQTPVIVIPPTSNWYIDLNQSLPNFKDKKIIVSKNDSHKCLPDIAVCSVDSKERVKFIPTIINYNQSNKYSKHDHIVKFTTKYNGRVQIVQKMSKELNMETTLVASEKILPFDTIATYSYPYIFADENEVSLDVANFHVLNKELNCKKYNVPPNVLFKNTSQIFLDCNGSLGMFARTDTKNSNAYFYIITPDLKKNLRELVEKNPNYVPISDEYYTIVVVAKSTIKEGEEIVAEPRDKGLDDDDLDILKKLYFIEAHQYYADYYYGPYLLENDIILQSEKIVEKDLTNIVEVGKKFIETNSGQKGEILKKCEQVLDNYKTVLENNLLSTEFQEFNTLYGLCKKKHKTPEDEFLIEKALGMISVKQ
jgi:hypothetical protein